MKKSNQAKASKHENGVDYISNMPDPILQLILQGLPTTEEVVRTSVLSTRWRYLWTSIPYFPSLDLDCYRTALTPSLKFPKKKFKDFVTWCLANRTVDLDSLRLCCASYYRYSTVNGWIKEAVNRNAKSLDLKFDHKSECFSDFDFPEWLVTCDTLEVLRLNLYCRAPLNLARCTELRFRALRVLELNNVYCRNINAIELFLRMSPLLEELTLIHCWLRVSGRDRILSPKLKTLIIRNWKKIISGEGFWRGVSVSCPELMSFEFNCAFEREVLIIENINSLKKAVILPNNKMQRMISYDMGDEICKVLAKISHVESLSVNLYFIQCIDAARDWRGYFPASFLNLKTLEVTTTIDAFTMNVIIRILRCSIWSLSIWSFKRNI
ncbi:F-box domain, FBD domain, Leucine-rich repeat domain, L domain-like protein [Artemisia annua]|uniref:F-box domain, FBD domain, Leucine-rich repeat domain, L domain-like protein n=1 Tax=Artemisia annua TaxID=35608 RepID=A0A2U1LPC4_ARTAN|nr:F-box domain, FBD domain, Leucine-rich repeat domain, L domain-like protein [Artemisia annua]